MKLRTLASILLTASLAIAMVFALAGFLVWQNAKSSVAGVENLLQARDSAYRVDVAIRYLTHLRMEPDILRGLAQQSRLLARLLEGESHPEVRAARLHLEEIGALARLALSEYRADESDSSIGQRLASLAEQMRIHESGALDALNAIIEDRNRSIVGMLQQTLGLLIVIAIIVAGLGFLVFWMFFRRLQRPLLGFSEGVRRFGDGDESVRIEVQDDDELGAVARLFNRAMEQRAAYQLELQERIKEQHCLYCVLELTSDEDRSVAEVCQEIAQLIPAHILHQDAAMARVRCDGVTFSSSNWNEPNASIFSPVMMDGKEVGRVEVAYSRVPPDQRGGEGPFLAEARTMLDSIALHVARMLQERKMRGELARSQRMQAVGELTGGIAHDFNNLLTVIQGNAELLGEMHLDSSTEVVELAAMIDTAARRGAELTNRLLAFARRQALQPRSIDINALIEEMRGLFKRTLGAQVEVELALAERPWPALVDPTQLETALLNLVVNARDAMPEGGWLNIETANVELDADYAETRPEVTPGDYVLVSVSDTGAGMSPELLERIFEPFFTTKEKSRGTGLGLSMVYGFVKQSHGHVAVYSEPEEGTTVRLYLPRSTERVRPPRPGQMQESLQSGTARILVVEDDDLVRRYTCDQLAALGYQVRSAGNGPEALLLLEDDEPVDLLLTDIVMPGGMSGKALADAACVMRPGLRVVFMSGYTENAIVHHGRLDPGVRLLSKPFRRRELARKIHEALAEGESDSRDTE